MKPPPLSLPKKKNRSGVGRPSRDHLFTVPKSGSLPYLALKRSASNSVPAE